METKKIKNVFSWLDLIKSIGMIAAATGVGTVFWEVGLREANITMVYILAVLVISVITTHQIYSLIFSFVSVIVYNFFFTVPRFTLHAYDKDYPITFAIMFLAAFLTGSLAARLKKQVHHSEMAAYRTQILLNTSQMLGQAKEREEIVAITTEQIRKLLNKQTKIYLMQMADLKQIKEKEGYLYLPIANGGKQYAAVEIVIGEKAIDSFEYNILLSILGECALALENEQNAREKAEAALMAQKEQMRANLLRAMSHDLRTPLTSISGNASNLILDENCFDEETRRQLYLDIYDDSVWLINLVENLLSISKIEEGRLNLHFTTELLDEVVTEALNHISRKKEEHEIITKFSEEFLLVKMDAHLIMQVIINILDNAIKYTQKDSKIVIISEKKDNLAIVHIADNGPGVLEKEKPYVFDMFFCGTKNLADSHRSLGLGLALCKSIINTHGGEIWLTDNKPSGAIFSFSLPVEEVNLHE